MQAQYFGVLQIILSDSIAVLPKPRKYIIDFLIIQEKIVLNSLKNLLIVI